MNQKYIKILRQVALRKKEHVARTPDTYIGGGLFLGRFKSLSMRFKHKMEIPTGFPSQRVMLQTALDIGYKHGFVGTVPMVYYDTRSLDKIVTMFAINAGQRNKSYTGLLSGNSQRGVFGINNVILEARQA